MHAFCPETNTSFNLLCRSLTTPIITFATGGSPALRERTDRLERIKALLKPLSHRQSSSMCGKMAWWWIEHLVGKLQQILRTNGGLITISDLPICGSQTSYFDLSRHPSQQTWPLIRRKALFFNFRASLLEFPFRKSFFVPWKVALCKSRLPGKRGVVLIIRRFLFVKNICFLKGN